MSALPDGATDADAVPLLAVQEEYLLLDRACGYPAPVADAVRSAVLRRPALGPDDVHGELLQVQVEGATPTCRHLDEVGGHLLRLRHELDDAAAEQGARLAATGAAPWHDGAAPVTDEARYREIRTRAPGLVEEQLINGMHVHVAVPDRAHGVEVLNRLRPDLPLLLAMSANSPYWRGRDTGFHSWRAVHLERWPVAGPPPHLRSVADHDARMEALLATGALPDARQAHWHARLSPRRPAVEVRCADVQLRVDDAVLLAGLVRALVTTALRDLRCEASYPVVPTELLRATAWSAARHGLDGDLYDLRQGRRRRTGDQVVGLLARMQPALASAGDEEQVGKLTHRLLREGTGAARQRDVAHRLGTAALCDFLAAETTSC